jgi:hypothetical protein
MFGHAPALTKQRASYLRNDGRSLRRCGGCMTRYARRAAPAVRPLAIETAYLRRVRRQRAALTAERAATFWPRQKRR